MYHENIIVFEIKSLYHENIIVFEIKSLYHENIIVFEIKSLYHENIIVFEIKSGYHENIIVGVGQEATGLPKGHEWHQKDGEKLQPRGQLAHPNGPVAVLGPSEHLKLNNKTMNV